MQLFTNTSQSNTASTSGSAASAAITNQSTDDLFTKLLVAQIKNQNPLDPTDSSEFVNQLTQLSQTSALQSLVSQSTNFASAIDSLQAQTLGAQVGNRIAVKSSTVSLGGSAIEGSFTLANPTNSAALVLTDTAGLKHRIELGAQSAGAIGFSLDAKTLGLAQGSYSIAVETASSETPSVEFAGTLQSVKLSASGAAVMNVSGIGDVAATQISAFLGKP